MIDTQNALLYEAALRELQAFKRGVGRGYRGRFTQIFFALKFYQNQLPSVLSGQFVSIELLQQMLDDLYMKVSRPPNDCVLVLFDGNYLARTGIIGKDNTSPQNTWRNNLHIQKGVVCYAPPADLVDQAFLDQSRAQCRYLLPPANGTLAGASCSLCVSGGTYRREDHRKWLRLDPTDGGYAVVDMLNVSNFAPYVAPEGHRIPVLPLMLALYHWAPQGLITGSRTVIDTADFAIDFNFSPSELATYFDDSVTNPHNAALLAAFPHVTYSSFAALKPGAGAPASTTSQPTLPLLPFVVPEGTAVLPPQVNTGWDAEQYVAAVLQANGWSTHDVSRQRVGYDLWIQKGRDTRYVDVKSSLGYCTPTLTAREWQQAQIHGQRYILAIVENFSPTGENAIHWMPNPASARTAREAKVVQFSIPRSAWLAATVGIENI